MTVFCLGGFRTYRSIKLVTICGVVLVLLLYRRQSRQRVAEKHEYEVRMGRLSPKLSAARSQEMKIKTILLWNKLFDASRFGLPEGRTTFVDRGCRVSNCAVWDRRDAGADLQHDAYDAVMFHGVELHDVPLVRRAHQRYVFYALESPGTTTRMHNRRHFFNWTMTYRRDSDIYAPFGHIRSKTDTRFRRYFQSSWKIPTFENMSIPHFVRNKTKIVAWITSNTKTQSRREALVRELSKYIGVETFGNGKNKCRGEGCHFVMEKMSKFYLSFENSICVDYVTEEFFRALRLNMVPIVYGGARYGDIAPPMSYIDARDFESPMQLARFVFNLHVHPERYNQYFWWRRFYTLDDVKGEDSWCRLCEMLNDENQPVKSYTDIKSWWIYEDVCHDPNGIFILDNK